MRACSAAHDGARRAARRGLPRIPGGVFFGLDSCNVTRWRAMLMQGNVRDPGLYVQSLVDLHQRPTEERRQLFRQALTALSRARVEDGPGPLEGLNPDLLALGLKAALADSLLENLDWLAPPAAGRALFLLAAALPIGPAQRDIGRRVLTRFFSGNAETFAAIATVMALSGGKVLASTGGHARVSLMVELPLMLGLSDGPFALALVSRREFAREWITGPSTRSLPSRRLAARLLERAAREAAKRAAQGDGHALRVFRGEAIGVAFERLLTDRESLVWRHVAVARGLIAPWVPASREELESSLSPELSPTEWRRAATSIAAYSAVRPDEGERMAAQLFRGRLPQLDPGIGGAFVWGLPRVAEAEPDAAYLLLDFALRGAPQDVAEAVLWTRDEFGSSHFCDGAAKKALGSLPAGESDDDGLREELRLDLSGAPRKREPLRREVERALSAFASNGAQAAHARGMALLDATKVAVGALDAAQEGPRRDGGGPSRRVTLGVLRDLDASLLERNVLADLVRLDTSQEKVAAGEVALDALREHLGAGILARQFSREASEVVGPLDLVRVRALLHLVDGDSSSSNDDLSQTARQKGRWQATALAVLERVARDPAPFLRRALLATLARCLDALVRVEELDVADAVLCAADSLSTEGDLVALAEASMNPDMRHMLAEYVRFLKANESDPATPPHAAVAEPDAAPRDAHADAAEGVTTRPAQAVERRVAALGRFAEELVTEGSARAEALRHVFVRLHAALVVVSKATSLRGMGGGAMPDAEVVQSLETAVVALAQVVRGARMRLEPIGKRTNRRESRLVSGGVRLLSVVVGRALVAGERVALGPLAATLAELTRGLPWALAVLVTKTASRLADLPVEARKPDEHPPSAEALPPWLPARRVLGAFFVQRPLGVGGSGSVFVANRLEDRDDPDAERFALKVPDYDASVARALSEEQFLDMFRSEAMALVGLPPHPNLARFVNFDLAARPKPILVMELVEGLSLELAVDSLALDMPRALRALGDVLAGLAVMHEAGLGHLDVKPSNVVLRDGEVAVLVDFGLSGRKLRPGCASGPYGAPEIWLHTCDASPLAADVYAFGCLLYEVLMGEVLFDADQQVALVSSHLVHDGGPARLSRLASKSGFASVAGLVSRCLRRDPKSRPTIEEVRQSLAELTPALEVLPWPALPPS